MVDAVLHCQVIEVIRHHAVHGNVRNVGQHGDEGAKEIKGVIAQRGRQRIRLVPGLFNTCTVRGIGILGEHGRQQIVFFLEIISILALLSTSTICNLIEKVLSS